MTSLTVTIQESHGLTSHQKTILGSRETWFWNLGEAGELCRTFWNGSRLENSRDWHSELLYWAELALSYSTQVWTFKALLCCEYLRRVKSGPSEDPFFCFQLYLIITSIIFAISATSCVMIVFIVSYLYSQDNPAELCYALSQFLNYL